MHKAECKASLPEKEQQQQWKIELVRTNAKLILVDFLQ